MSKKAFKIASAAAVAASAFVAVNPAQAATAAEAEVLVKKAENLGGTLKWAISLEGSWDGFNYPNMKLFNDTKAAHAKAVTAVSNLSGTQKAALETRLNNNVKLYVDRAVTLIDAVSAGMKIAEKQEALETKLNAEEIDATTVSAYHELAKEIRKQEVLLSRVYGQSSRAEIRENYQHTAEAVLEDALYPVSVQIELDRLDAAITAKNETEAKKRYDNVVAWLPLVTNATMKADLTAKFDSKKSAYEAIMVPKVESVSAINATQVVVKFNKELDETSATSIGNYYVNGVALAAPNAVVLNDDNKSVTLTFSASKNGSAFLLGVEDVKTADSKVVADYSTTVSVSDTVAPTVSKSAIAVNGDLEVTFSEPLGNVTPIVRVNGTNVTPTPVVAGVTKVVVPAAQLTGSAAVGNGATATVYVANAQDTAGNIMSIYNGTVTRMNDAVKPAISSITQIGDNKLRVVFTEKLGANVLADGELKFLKGATFNTTDSTVLKNTVVDPSEKTYDVTFVGTEVYGTADSASVSLILADKTVNDLSGNENDTYTQSFTFNKDKTAPVILGQALAQDGESVEVKFNEDLDGLTVDSTKIVVTSSEGVRYNLQADETVLKTGADNVLELDWVDGAVALPAGDYTVQFQAGAVKDVAGNSVAASTISVKVAESSDTAKPVVTKDATSGVNKYVINFSKEVTSSALNLANYKLDGAALPANTTVYFNSAAKTSVTIELPSNSINHGLATGIDGLLQVSGVVGKNGVSVDNTTLTVKVGDNTAAVLQSAQKLGNSLILTFNEALNSTTATDADFAAVLANYDIKVDGTLVAIGTGDATATLVAGTNNKVQITFAAGTTWDSTKPITVTTKTTGDLTDQNGLDVKGAVTVTAGN
jgi:trimeric autotransporter adhesin